MASSEPENYFDKLRKSFNQFFTASPNADVSNTDAFHPPPHAIRISEDEIKSEVKKIISNESGWDRVQEVFKYDETLGQRPQFLNDATEIVTSVGLIGFFIGAVLKTEQNKYKFKAHNSLEIYQSKRAATRAHVDFVYMNMVTGGTRIAARFLAFTGIIVGTSLVIQAYRNKTTFLDYTAGGALSGGLLRMHFGFKGLIAGSVVGGVFGTVFGVARYWQLRLGNSTYEDQRYEFLKKKIIQKKILMMELDNANK